MVMNIEERKKLISYYFGYNKIHYNSRSCTDDTKKGGLYFEMEC